MARIQKCVHCGNPFFGRRDAKTCSTRCRKGLQRRRQVLARIGSQNGGGRVDSLAQQAGLSGRQAGAAL